MSKVEAELAKIIPIQDLQAIRRESTKGVNTNTTSIVLLISLGIGAARLGNVEVSPEMRVLPEIIML